MFLYLVIIFAIILLLCTILIYISNNILKVKKYNIKNPKLPSNFENLKIVHISDVHSRIFGKDNYKVIKIIDKINPDIVIMSGDIINGNEKNIKGFVENYSKIYKNYPTYYSIGNHERKLGYKKYKEYIELLKEQGVHVIINGSEKFRRGNQYIVINALKFRENMQPKLLSEDRRIMYINYMKKKLNELNANDFNILITHDPENFKMYKELNVDLIFSGHIHGGLIRIGKLCLLSPRRKFFPKYSYGVTKEDSTTIIVSSGIGSASIPIRMFNRPEIVQVNLKR